MSTLNQVQSKLAERAYNLRQFHGKSRRQAAFELELSPDTIRRIENPKSGRTTTFKLATLQKMAAGYDVQVSDLIR